MKRTWKFRWMTLGAVWSVAIILTYWNWDRVNDLIQARSRYEELRSELQFQRSQSNQLIGVVKTANAYFKTIESIPLGLISVRGDIFRLADENAIKLVALTVAASQNPEMGIPCQVSFSGNYPNVFRFIRSIEKQPFYQTQKLFLQHIQKSETLAAELTLAVYLKITNNSEKHETSMMAEAPITVK